MEKSYYRHLSRSRLYVPALGFSAFFLMISGMIPFEVVLIPAIAASPKQAKSICLSVVLGSACGAITLAALTQKLGRPFISELFPHLTLTRGWIRAEEWIEHYGFFSLIATAALPIAQAPALILSGLLKIASWEVGLAFMIGKSLKYGTISYLTIRGENRIKAHFN